MNTALAHITLATRDVLQSQTFFEHTLGWTPIPRPGNIGRDAAWLVIAPNQELHLLRVDEFQPSPFEREFGRHIAITVPLTEFEPLKSRLRSAGAKLIDAERPTPFQRFFFQDPNGYIFEVVEANHPPELAPGPHP